MHLRLFAFNLTDDKVLHAWTHQHLNRVQSEESLSGVLAGDVFHQKYSLAAGVRVNKFAHIIHV